MSGLLVLVSALKKMFDFGLITVHAMFAILNAVTLILKMLSTQLHMKEKEAAAHYPFINVALICFWFIYPATKLVIYVFHRTLKD